MAVEKEHEQRRRNKIVLRDPTLPNRFLWLQIIKDIDKKWLSSNDATLTLLLPLFVWAQSSWDESLDTEYKNVALHRWRRLISITQCQLSLIHAHPYQHRVKSVHVLPPVFAQSRTNKYSNLQTDYATTHPRTAFSKALFLLINLIRQNKSSGIFNFRDFLIKPLKLVFPALSIQNFHNRHGGNLN